MLMLAAQETTMTLFMLRKVCEWSMPHGNRSCSCVLVAETRCGHHTLFSGASAARNFSSMAPPCSHTNKGQRNVVQDVAACPQALEKYAHGNRGACHAGEPTTDLGSSECALEGTPPARPPSRDTGVCTCNRQELC